MPEAPHLPAHITHINFIHKTIVVFVNQLYGAGHAVIHGGAGGNAKIDGIGRNGSKFSDHCTGKHIDGNNSITPGVVRLVSATDEKYGRAGGVCVCGFYQPELRLGPAFAQLWNNHIRIGSGHGNNFAKNKRRRVLSGQIVFIHSGGQIADPITDL